MFFGNTQQIAMRRARGLSRTVRVVALFAALFITAAESHEALLHFWELAAGPYHAASHETGSPKQRGNDANHSCAFCVLLATPALTSPVAVVAQPYVDAHALEPALQLAPVVRDVACFTYLRRAPPALSIA